MIDSNDEKSNLSRLEVHIRERLESLLVRVQ